MSSDKTQIIFFLGAGASVAAGVPDTYGLVESFKKYIKENSREHLRTVDTILQILQQKRKEMGVSDERVDVELLLDTLERLEKRNDDVVLWFHESYKYVLEGHTGKAPLERELKSFIKGTAIVEASKITYLEPLLEFVEEHGPLDVFSVNYDTCIEQFCDTYRKDFQDGFDTYWNPKAFERTTDVRLYKLHGSVTWYRSDRGNYLKIPILTSSPTIQLVSKEFAESLILYPIQKWEYAEPMLALLVELQRKLEDVSCAVVVGYSFRDEHLKRIFWDTSRKNKNLVLILIGPHATRTYEERLRYYYDKPNAPEPIPSSLDGRVICLPYKFEDVLPKLKNYYLSTLQRARNIERDMRTNEVQGNLPDWSQALSLYADCEYLSKVAELDEKVNWRKVDWVLRVQVNFKMLVNSLCHNEPNLFKDWGTRFTEGTPWLSHERYEAEFMVSPTSINLKVALTEKSALTIQQIIDSLTSVLGFVDNRISLTKSEETIIRLKPIAESIRSLHSYLVQFPYPGMQFETYVERRKVAHPKEMAALRVALESLKDSYDQNVHQTALNLITNVERGKIKPLISAVTENVSQAH